MAIHYKLWEISGSTSNPNATERRSGSVSSAPGWDPPLEDPALDIEPNESDFIGWLVTTAPYTPNSWPKEDASGHVERIRIGN